MEQMNHLPIQPCGSFLPIVVGVLHAMLLRAINDCIKFATLDLKFGAFIPPLKLGLWNRASMTSSGARNCTLSSLSCAIKSSRCFSKSESLPVPSNLKVLFCRSTPHVKASSKALLPYSVSQHLTDRSLLIWYLFKIVLYFSC